jgi:hypothetical protein
MDFEPACAKEPNDESYQHKTQRLVRPLLVFFKIFLSFFCLDAKEPKSQDAAIGPPSLVFP